MVKHEPKENDEKVECKVCLKEVPRSSALAEEVKDYVAYFCGLDCFTKWKNQGNNEKQ